MISDLELGWLAGILEGEGSFSKGPPSKPRMSRIQMQTTDEDVISRVARILGVRYCKIADRTDTGLRQTKSAFHVQLRGSRAVAWMRQLRPLMGQRRQQQIDAAIEGYEAGVVRALS